MYELVNTSLPNGLIAGTHGFSTVAMTKGLPDTLRVRIEAFCAYSHRASAHDATYFKENPLNWFHVILPQGEHVTGCVAPSEFDYTGRTNRLARLLVFQKGEMPAIGGAEILKKEYNRLIEPWSGDARWLENDKQVPVSLRVEMPAGANDAPAWRTMLGGEEGLRLAKGFARLLTKNLSGSGKTIYFKTSSTYDVDGKRLLTLFADLIALLPVELRRQVTFSTYPAALPQGTVCHLRGAYDRDRFFDVAATTQPWVDCERGVVHNASLLPEEDRSDFHIQDQSCTPQSYKPPRTGKTSVRPVPMSGIVVHKDSTKTLFVGIMICTLLLLLIVAAGIGVWLYREKKREKSTREELTVLQAQQKEDYERKLKATEDEARLTKELDELARRSREEETREAAKAANEAAEAKALKEQADAKKREEERKRREAEAKKEAKDAAERAKQEQERLNRDRVIFVEAKEVKIIEESIENRFLGEEERMTNGSLRVFWYNRTGTITNRLAGFTMNKTTKAFRFDPKPDVLAKEVTGTFLIWLDVKNNVVYWDWSPLKYKKPEAWFVSTNETINLNELCFGKEVAVQKFWNDKSGESRFSLELIGGQRAERISSGYVFSLKNEVEKRYQKQKSEQQGKEEIKEKRTEYEKQKKELEEAKKEYVSLCNVYSGTKKVLEDLRKGKVSRNKTFDGDGEKEKRKKLRETEEKINKHWDSLKNIKSFFGFTLKFDNYKITGWDEIIKELDNKIEELKTQENAKKESEQEAKTRIESELRKGKFRIVKVEVN